jgi:hypothetical protein
MDFFRICCEASSVAVQLFVFNAFQKLPKPRSFLLCIAMAAARAQAYACPTAEILYERYTFTVPVMHLKLSDSIRCKGAVN